MSDDSESSLFRIASLIKRRGPASRSGRASAACSVAGRPERKTNGSVPADTSGIRSIPERLPSLPAPVD